MRICLFEDHGVADLEPLALTRPVFDLLCGLSSLSAKQARYFAPCSVAVMVRPFLAEVTAERRPDLRVNDAAWLRLGPVVMVNGRWLPPDDNRGIDLTTSGPCVGTVGGDVAFAVVTPNRLADCTPASLQSCLDDWKQSLPRREAGGAMMSHPWELIDHNADQIGRDFRARPEAADHPHDFALIGPADRLWIEPSAKIDPLVVVDTTNGPVVVDRNAHIGSFTRLDGPCHVGAGTQVLGAKIRGGTTLGPCCRIGGEIEASIVQGFSNKYHDGFLGHSYVGEWVNIGAGAQTSDLRNDYGEIIMTVGGRQVPTGRTKVGSFIGDHVKIGLGALLNTGSNIGAFAGLLPAGKLLPRHVPSFCMVSHGALSENENIDVLFLTAQEVMHRRAVRLTDAQRAVYHRVFDQTALQRRQAVRDAEPRRHRRAA
jgi:UDP-N-acetylglucosamine diphosphorylase/glucosamine-1-phosphate N-acetyltransferase